MSRRAGTGGKVAQGGIIDEAARWMGDKDDGPELVVPLTVPDCATAEGCPAAGRGHWLRHVDKDGQRSTVTEPDGNVWNRACPVAGCTRRVFG